MKAKDYRLSTVLKIRQHVKDEAGRVVATRIEQLDEAQKELTERQGNLLACYELQNQKQSDLDQVANDGTQAKNLIAHRAFLSELRQKENQLKQSEEKQRTVVARAENELESARDVLSEAVREFRAIETHRSKWEVTLQTDALRKEQKTNDAIGAAIVSRAETNNPQR